MAQEPRILDVRPILASGGQPLAAIREATDGLEPGQALRLLAPFRPDPLFRLMENRGYEAHVSDLPDGGCEVLFLPAGKTEQTEGPAVPSPLTWTDPVRFLDLTDSDEPEIRQRVLGALERADEGDVIFVLLNHMPAFLYSDLTSRRHGWVGNFDAAGENYRILIRSAGRQAS